MTFTRLHCIIKFAPLLGLIADTSEHARCINNAYEVSPDTATSRECDQIRSATGRPILAPILDRRKDASHSTGTGGRVGERGCRYKGNIKLKPSHQSITSKTVKKMAAAAAASEGERQRGVAVEKRKNAAAKITC
jgi:hypothetical protein